MSLKQSMRVARVLSISGDGARTAMAAHVLADLERRTGQPLHRLFHLIVGEGAGAVLAMLVSLRSAGGRGLPLDAEAAAIAIEEGLPENRVETSWWSRAQARLFANTTPSTLMDTTLTGPEGILAGADLSSAQTDLAIPVFDVANVRPFLFRSWKAQGLYLADGEGSGRYEFRGHDMAAAALRHPGHGAEAASIRARSRAEFQLSGGGALAPDPVSLAALQARHLYRRAYVIQTVSMVFGGPKTAPDFDWGQAGQRALSQITAKGMAEQVLTLRLPANIEPEPAARSTMQAHMRTLVERFFEQEESNGFSRLVREYSETRALPHAALRTPQVVGKPAAMPYAETFAG